MDLEVAKYLKQMARLTRHARNVFLAAILICGLLALDSTLLKGKANGQLAVVRASFGPLSLWALVAAVHAFHLLARAHAAMTQRAVATLAADRERARTQLEAVKQRLRSSASHKAR